MSKYIVLIRIVPNFIMKLAIACKLNIEIHSRGNDKKNKFTYTPNIFPFKIMILPRRLCISFFFRNSVKFLPCGMGVIQ